MPTAYTSTKPSLHCEISKQKKHSKTLLLQTIITTATQHPRTASTHRPVTVVFFTPRTSLTMHLLMHLQPAHHNFLLLLHLIAFQALRVGHPVSTTFLAADLSLASRTSSSRPSTTHLLAQQNIPQKSPTPDEMPIGIGKSVAIQVIGHTAHSGFRSLLHLMATRLVFLCRIHRPSHTIAGTSNLMTRTPINLLQRWKSPQRLLHLYQPGSRSASSSLAPPTWDKPQTSARRLVSHSCFQMSSTTILSSSRCNSSNHVSQHQPKLLRSHTCSHETVPPRLDPSHRRLEPSSHTQTIRSTVSAE